MKFKNIKLSSKDYLGTQHPITYKNSRDIISYQISQFVILVDCKL